MKKRTKLKLDFRDSVQYCFHFRHYLSNFNNWFSTSLKYLCISNPQKIRKIFINSKELQNFFLVQIYYYLRRSVRYFSHNFLKCGCFFSLFLIVQSDFLAKFPRISHYRIRLWFFRLACLFWVNESLIFLFFFFAFLCIQSSTITSHTYYSRLKLSKWPKHTVNNFAIAFKLIAHISIQMHYI